MHFNIIEESVDNDDLGAETGRGFYDYFEDSAEKPREGKNLTILEIRQVLKKT